MATVARVALPRPLRRFFDYRIPEGLHLECGMRVRVPFGPRSQVGIVVALDPPDPAQVALKPIQEALENWPVFPGETLQTLLWAARYYHHPPGECLFAALPALLRQGRAVGQDTARWWQLCPKAGDQSLPARAHRQKALLDWLRQQAREAVSEQAIREAGFGARVIQGLEKQGFIRPAEPAPPSDGDEPIQPLNPSQAAIMEALPRRTDSHSTHLIYGITGSGKTEVYMHFLKNRLTPDCQALVLVPEINLTPQTLARFRRHFGSRIRVWHSALSAGERLALWRELRQEQPLVVIGTRSAVLLPFTRLATLIVDEEHDSSYKQQEGFRYSARDLAIYRGYRNECPVILGSATPSLESLRNALEGRYTLHRLDKRAGPGRLPHRHLIDIRSRPLEAGLSQPLIGAIGETLDRAEQALIFINRRGYAPVIMCLECQTIIDCPHCDSHLAWHRQDNALRCHHCDHLQPLPRACPACGAEALQPVGQGTERAEELLRQRFPDVPLLRIDRDSTRRKGSLDQLLKPVREGRPCILVGTQMLAKGHDFPGVTLVGVLNADGGLFSAQFRAPETLVQTLTQVSGRAGRGAGAGRVLIQTAQAGHPLLEAVLKEDYLTIASRLLEERRQTGLPPYSAMASLMAEAPSAAEAEQMLEGARQHLETCLNAETPCRLMGPIPALLARKAGRHRAYLLLQAPRRQPIQALCTQLESWLDQHPSNSRRRWYLDIDPLTLE